MPYTPLPAADYEVGKPVKEELFDTIATNQDQFNSDIQSLQQVSKVDVFNIKISGKVEQYSTAQITSILPGYKAPVSATLVSFVVTLLEASTSGTLEVEIDRSVDDGVNWTPLLSSPVELTGTTVGSVSGAVNWVDVPSQSFDQNDLLRLRFTSVQVDQGAFNVSVYGEI